MLGGETAKLDHFEALFTRSADPWGTYRSHSEAFKRRVLLRMLGAQRHGRVLELGCGNGSNSRELARHALSLDAIDGSTAALERAAAHVEGLDNVRLCHAPLPGRFPGNIYDAIIIAEVLYYLDDRTFCYLMRETVRTLRPGGLLVLCHHHRQFADAAQRQADLHRRCIMRTPARWRLTRQHRTFNWEALSLRRPIHRHKDIG